MVRFTQPESVRNVGVLFSRAAGPPNDYFLYQPELRRVRRLPRRSPTKTSTASDRVPGFGVAQSEPTEVDGMKRETVDGRPAYRLTERALRDNPRFDERVTWSMRRRTSRCAPSSIGSGGAVVARTARRAR